MHINTAVIKHILPLLEKYEGQPVSKIPFGAISEEILRLTKKAVNYRRVLPSGVDLARADYKGTTFSLNIDHTSEFRQEMEESSQARRDRFRHLYAKSNFPEARVGIKLEAIRSDICFTINYILEPESQCIYFAAIIGFYGTSINGWADRVGLKETQNGHSTPSTHYMTNEAAREYVFLIDKIVTLKVAE